jgi:NAD(P)-dependent dehydrogenase (short-subunit alcohol dehydrogenase family)
MKLEGKTIIVTGGARGIGRALVRRFFAERPKAIVVADRDLEGAREVAGELGETGLALACDVGREADIQDLIHRTIERHGRVDLLCSNAGIGSGLGVEASDAEWQRLWNVNLMSHVWAARALLPSAAQPGGVHFMITASAAGLLSMIGDAPYTVTKHAAVGLAEWLSIMYADSGLHVSCLCPLFVNTDLLAGALALAGGETLARSGPVLEPEQVADAVVVGLESERFLILPHQEVAGYFKHKAADHERWLTSMRKLSSGRRTT